MGSLRKLFRYEQTSALLMLLALMLALAAANSPLAPLYEIVHHMPVHLRFGLFVIEEPLVQWINQGLMVVFFLLVGLEIKREILEGHLSTTKCALLPAFAALGGMAVPAAIYVALNWTDPILIRGWAIPTATDIVLALGMLSLLGSRVPTTLKVFLTAIAIFDDIGAVLIIGLFYGEELSVMPLMLFALSIGGLVLLNALRASRSIPYIVIGLFLWVAMLKSGIEASLAGILIALAVPIRLSESRCSSPLRKTERRLHPWGVLVVVPLFAFFNAGIAVDGEAVASLWTSAPLGIMAGLIIGKPVGVLGAAWLAVKLGIGQTPRGTGWLQIYGAALLAGIGFTMSLFIASLAFPDPTLVAASKLAILLGSLVSAFAGMWIIHYSTGADRQRAGRGAGVWPLP